MGADKSCSDTHGNFITDPLTCKYAAKKLGKIYESIVDDVRRPKGCFVELTKQGNLGEKVFFNENLSKKQALGASPICAIGKYKIHNIRLFLRTF